MKNIMKIVSRIAYGKGCLLALCVAMGVILNVNDSWGTCGSVPYMWGAGNVVLGPVGSPQRYRQRTTMTEGGVSLQIAIQVHLMFR